MGKKSKIADRKQRAEARKGCEATAREHAQQLRQDQARAVHCALHERPDPEKSLIQEALRGQTVSDSLKQLLGVVVKKAPKLILRENIPAFEQIANAVFVRNPEDWKPKGKGRNSLFRSLCEHLLMRYKTPAFLWSGFQTTGQEKVLGPVVALVASGKGLHQLVKEGTFPVPLTKAMCHDFLTNTTASMTMLEGVRRAQINAFGGGHRLYRAWMGTDPGRSIKTAVEEAFWITVIQWFAANPMLDPNQIGPLTDYIRFKRNEEPAFTMKGRSATALFRSMEQWHKEVNLVNRAGARIDSFDERIVFNRSGFKNGKFDFTYFDKKNRECEDKWFIDEILTGKALKEEGKVMHHCVVSYSGYITKGEASIWSVVHQTNPRAEKVLTLEVRNQIKQVVQMRGVCNRAAEARELNVVQMWAGQNGLTVNCGRW